MKKNILLLAILLMCFNIFGQGIEFYKGTFEEAIETAKEEKKAIFVDAYTTWCGPCKKMSKNVFTDKAVGEFFNEKFINLKLDMEKEEGVKFGHKYPVSAYPTLYFIDSNGEVLKKVVGGQKPASFISQAKGALILDDKSDDFEELYVAGHRDYELVYNYVSALNNVGKPSIKISNDYLKSNPDITEEQRLNFLFEAAVEADSKIFEDMVSQKKEIIALVGEKKYQDKVIGACQKTVDKALEYEFEDLMHEAIAKSDKELNADAQVDFEFNAKMNYYNSFNKNDEYYNAAKQYVKKSNNPEVISKVAVDVCANLKTNKKAVKEAVKWAKEAFKDDPNESNLTNYCKTLLAAKDYKKVLDLVDDAENSKDKKYSNRMLNMIKKETQRLQKIEKASD